MNRMAILFAVGILSMSVVSAQRQQNLPTDAPVDVFLTDKSKNPLPNEIVVFRSAKNSAAQYRELTDSLGELSVYLPAGDVYEYYVYDMKDTIPTKDDIKLLEIPALKPGQMYSDESPFIVNFTFQPAKDWDLEGCNFDNGKATLQPGSFAILDRLVSYLQRKSDQRIEVGGHTDNVGKKEANQKLSQDRANTVRDYLVSKGIDPARITTKGYGDSQPVDTNKTEAGRAENRRIEVSFLEQL
jgi:outer membrane protein OmpA-like peptidoglycan-associated protein